jgi:hypothetical protein
MSGYERIRYGGKTVYLTDVTEVTFLGQPCLKGTEVNREADLRQDRSGAYIDHVVSLDLITKRTPVFIDHKYGDLTDNPTQGDTK